MNTYISLLRGINVSGQKIIKMQDLKKLYESLGLQDVITYIQSGNVIFKNKEQDTDLLRIQLIKKINDVYGFDVKILIKTRQELITIKDKNPFLSQPDIDPKKLCFTLLSTKPDHVLTEQISSLDFSPDLFLINDTEIYLYCPHGFGQTKLTNTFFERRLNVNATSRNLRTINKLIELAD